MPHPFFGAKEVCYIEKKVAKKKASWPSVLVLYIQHALHGLDLILKVYFPRYLVQPRANSKKESAGASTRKTPSRILSPGRLLGQGALVLPAVQPSRRPARAAESPATRRANRLRG